MKCKFCGAKMSSSDNLCTECGRLKTRPLEPVPDYSDREKGKSQRFFTMGKNLFYRFILFPVILIPAVWMAGAVILGKIFDSYDLKQIILTSVIAVMILYIVLTAVSISKCYVEVYKNCIEGRIPAKIPCFTKRFTVFYDDIIRVNSHGIGMSASTTRRSSDSHPRFILVTDFGAINIKGLNDSQAAEIHALLRAYRNK